MLLLALLAGCPKPPSPAPSALHAPPASPPACGVHADGSQTFAILHVNDVYRIEGLLDGRGGMARLRRARADLEATCPDLLVTHGGDLLSPSMLTKSTNTTPKAGGTLKVATYGAHMVDLLSRLDGDPAAVDPRMFVAFGNHEFDNGGDTFGPILQRLVDSSGYTWLDTNLTWKPVGEFGAPTSARLAPHAVVTFGALRVGLVGLTLPVGGAKPPAYLGVDPDRAGVAQRELSGMGGLDVALAVTHLDIADDLALLRAVPELDLVLGGHNHTAMTERVEDGRYVLKADADAATVRIVYVTVHPDGRVEVTPDGTTDRPGTPLTGDPDPAAQAAVDDWEAWLRTAFCGSDDRGCLDEVLTRTATPFVAEELEMRRFETNVGDFVADQALAAYPDAQLAFVNSGGLRLNQNLPAGVDLRRRQVEELFPYPMVLYLLELTGAELQGVADRAVQAWEGNGHWLQVSGWGFVHDPSANGGAGAASRLTLLPPGGGAPVAIDPSATYRVVTNAYLVTSADRDGYTFPVRQVAGVRQGDQDLKVLTTRALRAAPETALPLDGRICNVQRPEAPCRIR